MNGKNVILPTMAIFLVLFAIISVSGFYFHTAVEEDYNEYMKLKSKLEQESPIDRDSLEGTLLLDIPSSIKKASF